MGNWNRNEWQSKRKDQVEFSTKVTFYSLIGGVLVIIFGILYNLF